MRSHAGDLVFFRLRELVDLADVGISQLLHFLETIVLVVFRNLLVLQHLFQTLIRVSADVGHGSATVLGNLVNLFRDSSSTFVATQVLRSETRHSNEQIPCVGKSPQVTTVKSRVLK